MDIAFERRGIEGKLPSNAEIVRFGAKSLRYNPIMSIPFATELLPPSSKGLNLTKAGIWFRPAFI